MQAGCSWFGWKALPAYSTFYRRCLIFLVKMGKMLRTPDLFLCRFLFCLSDNSVGRGLFIVAALSRKGKTFLKVTLLEINSRSQIGNPINNWYPEIAWDVPKIKRSQTFYQLSKDIRINPLTNETLRGVLRSMKTLLFLSKFVFLRTTRSAKWKKQSETINSRLL